MSDESHQHVGPMGTVTCYATHAEPPHDLVPRLCAGPSPYCDENCVRCDGRCSPDPYDEAQAWADLAANHGDPELGSVEMVYPPIPGAEISEPIPAPDAPSVALATLRNLIQALDRAYPHCCGDDCDASPDACVAIEKARAEYARLARQSADPEPGED